jgi:anti-anti-sigma factor
MGIIMTFDIQKHGGSLIVQISKDRIDAACVIKFTDIILSTVAKLTERIILNLESAIYMGSSSLEAIVGVMEFMGQLPKA